MTRDDSRERLVAEIESALAATRPEVEVVDVVLLGPQNLVRVLIDSPSGVDLALCEGVARDLTSVRERYGLEVSSPGVDRPLTKPAHYRRAVGETVKARLREPQEGRRRIGGRLLAAGDESFRVALEGGGELEVPYTAVDRCNIVWNPVTAS